VAQQQKDILTDELRQKLSGIKLKWVDGETEEAKYVTLDEAQAWDWHNQEIWRMVKGWQIPTFEALIGMLFRKLESGQTEVEILEAPRFVFLAGG
jgi:hypothetical protein